MHGPPPRSSLSPYDEAEADNAVAKGKAGAAANPHAESEIVAEVAQVVPVPATSLEEAHAGGHEELAEAQARAGGSALPREEDVRLELPQDQEAATRPPEIGSVMRFIFAYRWALCAAVTCVSILLVLGIVWVATMTGSAASPLSPPDSAADAFPAGQGQGNADAGGAQDAGGQNDGWSPEASEVTCPAQGSEIEARSCAVEPDGRSSLAAFQTLPLNSALRGGWNRTDQRFAAAWMGSGPSRDRDAMFSIWCDLGFGELQATVGLERVSIGSSLGWQSANKDGEVRVRHLACSMLVWRLALRLSAAESPFLQQSVRVAPHRVGCCACVLGT